VLHFPLRRKIRRQRRSQIGRERVRDPIKLKSLGGKRVNNLTYFPNR